MLSLDLCMFAIPSSRSVGNVLRSFYAFPAVVQIAGVYSPLSLLIACMVIFLYRPFVHLCVIGTSWTEVIPDRVMTELASALPYNASNYAYLLNTTSKTFALVAAALALLDASTTASVSAASFAAYVQGEVSLPFAAYWITVIVLAGFVLICLSGLKESVALAFSMLCIHVRAPSLPSTESCPLTR